MDRGHNSIETEARAQAPDRHAEIRQSQSSPHFYDPEALLRAQLPRISGKSLLPAVIRYEVSRLPMRRAHPTGPGRALPLIYRAEGPGATVGRGRAWPGVHSNDRETLPR